MSSLVPPASKSLQLVCDTRLLWPSCLSTEVDHPCSTAAPSLNIFKESTLGGNGTTNTTKMPRLLDLTNKTPFGNHHLPDSPGGGAFGSPLKAPFQLPASSSLDAPETILRPSKARTSLRVPRVSGGSANGGLPPCTPAPFGRRKHWEALSPGDVSVEEAAGEVLDEAQTDMDDEIEYMPPPVTGMFSFAGCLAYALFMISNFHRTSI